MEGANRLDGLVSNCKMSQNIQIETLDRMTDAWEEQIKSTDQITPFARNVREISGPMIGSAPLLQGLESAHDRHLGSFG